MRPNHNFRSLIFVKERAFNTIENNDKETLLGLLKEGGISVNEKDSQECSLLYRAIEKNSIKIVELLLQLPEIDPNIQGALALGHRWCYTPLCKAVEKGSIEIVKLLLQVPRIDPNILDRNGRPLTIAIKKGNVEIVKLLLKSPNIKVNAGYGRAPIDMLLSSLSLKNSTIEILKLLILHGAEVKWNNIAQLNDKIERRVHLKHEEDSQEDLSIVKALLTHTYTAQQIAKAMKAGSYDLTKGEFYIGSDKTLQIVEGKINSIPLTILFNEPCAVAQFEHALKAGLPVERLLGFIEAMGECGLLKDLKEKILHSPLNDHMELLESLVFVAIEKLEIPMSREAFYDYQKITQGSAKYPLDTEEGMVMLKQAKENDSFKKLVIKYLTEAPGILAAIKDELPKYSCYITAEQKAFFTSVVVAVEGEATPSASEASSSAAAAAAVCGVRPNETELINDLSSLKVEDTAGDQ